MNFYSLLSIQNNCSMFIIPLSLLHSECPVYLKKLTSVSWLLILLLYGWTSLVAQTLKNLPAMQETWVWSLVRKIPWKREWLSTPVFLPGEFHGQRSLLGYSSWGCKELDMTSMSNFFFDSLIHQLAPHSFALFLCHFFCQMLSYLKCNKW